MKLFSMRVREKYKKNWNKDDITNTEERAVDDNSNNSNKIDNGKNNSNNSRPLGMATYQLNKY